LEISWIASSQMIDARRGGKPAFVSKSGDGRRFLAFYRIVELFLRDAGDTDCCVVLVPGQAGLASGVGASETGRGDRTSYCWSAARARLDLVQQLAASADRARLDAICHLAQFVVLDVNPKILMRRSWLRSKMRPLWIHGYFVLSWLASW
jgi:hypothetical protein